MHSGGEKGIIKANRIAGKWKVGRILTDLRQEKRRYRYLFWDIDGTVLGFAAAVKALFGKYGFGACPDEMVDVYSGINGKANDKPYAPMMEIRNLKELEKLL